MACKIKTSIRLDKVRIRQLKTSYKGLKPQEYKLIKLIEQEEQYERDKNRFWRYVVRDENGMACAEGNNWEFFNCIDKLHRSIFKKLDNLQKKWGWTEEDILRIKGSHLQNNTHSQSFGA